MDSRKSNVRDKQATVRIIGDRSSGKTAYLASLAYWPNAKTSSPVQSVTPMGEESAELVDKAKNILEQGLQLEQTDLNPNVDDVKDYTLNIKLHERFSWKNPTLTLGKQLVQLNISSRDYSGEFFADLIHSQNDPLLDNYLADCLNATGILFLLDGTTHRKDKEYATGLDRFLTKLDRADLSSRKRRIALTINKCDRPELWVNSRQPEYLAKTRFENVYQRLESWNGTVDYFAASAFGMLEGSSNSIQISRSRDGTFSTIKNPHRWKPFGLVSPIYWLCTGKRHRELDRD